MKTKHYTKEELELYRHNEMSILGRMQCAGHIRECAECRRRLDELREDDALVGELRESLRIQREFSAPPAMTRSASSTPSR